MKKFTILLTLLLCSCGSVQNIYTYKNIDIKQKTISVSATNLSDMHQELKQALRSAGFKVLVKNDSKDSGYTKATSRYELSDNFDKSIQVICPFPQDGIAYAISVIDLKNSEEVFSMQGHDCKQGILDNFNALIRNKYHPIKDTYIEESSEPMYSIGGYNLWGK